MIAERAGGQGLIHVAGVIDAAEAEMLIDCGFTHLGFPLVLDHHAEDLSPEAAGAIVAALAGKLQVGMVQLHGEIAPTELRRLRALVPHLRIIKSLIVRGDNLEALIEEVGRLAPLVDSFITDTFDPLTGARGATGKTHDRAVSRRLVEASPKPVILAGGLNPGNLREAVLAVRPAGVDVHTGIEGLDGRKRRDLSSRFVAEARSAFAEIGG